MDERGVGGRSIVVDGEHMIIERHGDIRGRRPERVLALTLGQPLGALEDLGHRDRRREQLGLTLDKQPVAHDR